MVKFLAVLDFDHTIIDDNSDTVVTKLLPQSAVSENVKALNPLQGWTAYMQEIFVLLDKHGVREQEIKNSVIDIPPVPDFISFFQFLKTADCEVIIISDSNSYFIEEWLNSKEIREIVSQIFTNPAHFDNGRLVIEKYHIQNWCHLSTQNLCKGFVMTKFLKDKKSEGITYEHVVYIGDGHNDLCPSLRLNYTDFTFPRVGYPLNEILEARQEDIKATVVPWKNTNDIIEVIRLL